MNQWILRGIDGLTMLTLIGFIDFMEIIWMNHYFPSVYNGNSCILCWFIGIEPTTTGIPSQPRLITVLDGKPQEKTFNYYGEDKVRSWISSEQCEPMWTNGVEWRTTKHRHAQQENHWTWRCNMIIMISLWRILNGNLVIAQILAGI